jgi:membrane associated rhomboid family serine protease
MFFPYKDDNPRILIPYVTYGIITVNVLVFLYQFTIPQPNVREYFFSVGVIPHRIFSDGIFLNVPSLFTSLFVHGGLFHLLGNMWYLWLFGDNVEGSLGHTRYLIFYLLSGLAAIFTQVVISSHSNVPIIGASGAISGVLGAYLIRYPRAMVHVFVFFFYYITTIRIAAVWVLGIWFVINLTSGLSSLGGTTGGIAWFAHIGGFIGGIILFFLMYNIRVIKVEDDW